MIDKKYMILIGLTMELVMFELVLVYGGKWVDERYGWPGYGVMIGAFLGFAIWVFHLIVALKGLSGDEN